MKDLRRAAREGRHALMASLSRFPARHPFLISAVAMFALAVVVGFGLVESRSASRDINVLRPQVTQIVKAAAACKPPVTAKRLAICVSRIEAGLQACRLSPSCREAFADVLVAPRKARGGDALQPASNAGQQPEPGQEPGGRGQKGKTREPKAPKPKSPKGKPKPKKAKSQPAPVTTSPESTSSFTGPEESPGNSGETPAAQKGNGVKTCLDLVVSACADLGLDLGH